MKRTQIYLAADQYDFLETLAFMESKKEHKRVSVSEIIRNAINVFRETHIRNQSEEMDLLNMRQHASPSLEELWFNKTDDEYDRL